MKRFQEGHGLGGFFVAGRQLHAFVTHLRYLVCDLETGQCEERPTGIRPPTAEAEQHIWSGFLMPSGCVSFYTFRWLSESCGGFIDYFAMPQNSLYPSLYFLGDWVLASPYFERDRKLEVLQRKAGKLQEVDPGWDPKALGTVLGMAQTEEGLFLRTALDAWLLRLGANGELLVEQVDGIAADTQIFCDFRGKRIQYDKHGVLRVNCLNDGATMLVTQAPQEFCGYFSESIPKHQGPLDFSWLAMASPIKACSTLDGDVPSLYGVDELREFSGRLFGKTQDGLVFELK